MIKIYVCDISKISSNFINKFDNESIYTIAEYKCLYSIFDNFDIKDFKHDSLGSPYVNDAIYHISISHSSNLVIIGVSENNIGVDIELIKDIDNKLINRVLTNDELKNVSNSSSFFKIWTIKEAIIKYTKLGTKLPISSFSNNDYFLYKTNIKYKDYMIGVVSKEFEEIEIIEIN